MFIYGDDQDPYYQAVGGHARALDGLANLLNVLPIRNTTAIDVGANIGLSTILMARFAERVISVEPSPANVGYLRQNLSANGITNVEVIAAAASDKPDRLRFHEARFGAGSHVVQAEHLLSASIGTIDVPAVTLDSLARFSIGFIKIDAEGHEPEVLAGARAVLTRDRPAIHAEINVWCLTAFAGHNVGTFISKLWEVFEVSTLEADGSPRRPHDPYSFLHDVIAHKAGVADVLLMPRDDAVFPSLREMTWPKPALAMLPVVG